MAPPDPAPGIEVKLEFPPPSLSPNERTEKHAKWEAIATYRHSCKTDALNARRAAEHTGLRFPLQPPISLRVRFVLPNKRRRDWDNLIASFKSGMDGLVDAGLITDDSIGVIERVQYEWDTGPRAVYIWLGALE